MQLAILRNGNLKDFNFSQALLGVAPSTNERVMLKLLQKMEPPSCNFESYEEETLACDKTLFVGEEIDTNTLLDRQKFDTGSSADDSLYWIQEAEIGFSAKLVGFKINPLSIARRLLLLSSRAYEESGVQQNWLDRSKLYLRQMKRNEARKRFGSLIDQTLKVRPITLSTNTYYTFIVFTYFLSLAIVCFLAEYVYQYCQKYFSK
jgi:hypothetical protein